MKYYVFPTLAFALVLPVTASAQTAGVLAHKGDIVGGKVQTALSSKSNHNGDTFALTEEDTFFHHHSNLHGAVIEGHLENVSAAGPTHKATMTVVFDDVKLPDGTTAPLSAKVDSLSAPTHHIRDAMIIAGTAVAGHVMASKTGHQHGGLAGAAAGFALVSTMKSDIVLKRGTLVKLRLTGDLAASH